MKIWLLAGLMFFTHVGFNSACASSKEVPRLREDVRDWGDVVRLLEGDIRDVQILLEASTLRETYGGDGHFFDVKRELPTGFARSSIARVFVYATKGYVVNEIFVNFPDTHHVRNIFDEIIEELHPERRQIGEDFTHATYAGACSKVSENDSQSFLQLEPTRYLIATKFYLDVSLTKLICCADSPGRYNSCPVMNAMAGDDTAYFEKDNKVTVHIGLVRDLKKQ